jgi:dTDP-4-dehydrorhamnose reductase
MADRPVTVVTGAGGQVGRALRASLPSLRYLTHDELDVRDGPAVADVLRGATCIVHLAAMTHVDRCQQQPQLAWDTNGQGTANVCRAAAEGVRVIYVSTDYVFSGGKGEAYTEEDVPQPGNVYGETKLAGEREVLARSNSLVLRTSWVYGEGANFVRTILTAARSGTPLRVVADQIGRPTSARSVAGALAFLLERPVTGLLHVSGEGPPTTWAGFAEAALSDAGVEASVEHITTAEYGAPAPRPANSTLCLSRARELGVPLHSWRAELRRFVRAGA